MNDISVQCEVSQTSIPCTPYTLLKAPKGVPRIWLWGIPDPSPFLLRCKSPISHCEHHSATDQNQGADYSYKVVERCGRAIRLVVIVVRVSVMRNVYVDTEHGCLSMRGFRSDLERLTDDKSHGQDAYSDSGKGQDSPIRSASGYLEAQIKMREVGGLTMGQNVFVVLQTVLQQQNVVCHQSR